MVKRFDVGELKKPVRTPDGFLRAEGFITRVGVFPYRQADGSILHELRHPDDVFDAESLASFGLVPLTNGHPQGFVTADNYQLHQVGMVGPPTKDGAKVRADIVIMDPKAMAAAEGGRNQLSGGYHAELIFGDGEWEGQKYNARQTKIRGNHVALVDMGRAGPEIRLRLDAGDACDPQLFTRAEAPNKEKSMKKIRLDGVEYEVSEQVAQAIEKAQEKADGARAAVTAELESTKGKLAAAEGKAKELEAKLADATDEKKIQARIDARSQLEGRARMMLGAGAKFDGLTDRQVMVKALQKDSPKETFEGKSDGFVEGAFTYKADALEKENPDLARTHRAVVDAANADEDDIDKARKEHEEKQRNRWKPGKKSA